MKNIYKNLVFAVVGVLALSSAAAFGQGRYAQQYSRNDVSNIIRRAEDSSDKFRTDFRRELDRSNLNSTLRNRYNGYVANCENALDSLRSNFDRDDNWWNSRNQVQSVVSASQQVNTMMNTLAFRRNLERQWNQLRNDINKLADTFDLPGLNGGGWNGGGNGPGFPGGGGIGGNVPNWAIGTFYGRNPNNGNPITMTINRNGQVALSFDNGYPSYGTLNRTTLSYQGQTSTISRIGNGIRTRNNRNGEVIDYYTTQQGGGGIYPPIGGGGGNVPNWAVGTFYGRNPQNGEVITMTVSNNGSVTVVFGTGYPTYATLNGTSLRVGNETATVTRLGNGIRTRNDRSGEIIAYTRNR